MIQKYLLGWPSTRDRARRVQCVCLWALFFGTLRPAHANEQTQAQLDAKDAQAGSAEPSSAAPSSEPSSSASDAAPGAEGAAAKPARQSVTERLERDRKKDYWEAQQARPFVAAKVVVGAMSTLQAFAGYGRPQWMWGGVAANAFITTDMFVASGGLQLELLVANAFVRVRHVHTFARHQPALADSYDKESLRDNAQPRSFYTAAAAALWGYLPVGPTMGMWIVNGEYILNFPKDNALFSEFLRFTFDQNRGIMPQLAWWYLFDDNKYMIGPAADVALTPGRPPLWRAGASFVARFGPHFSLQTWLTIPVKSPDSIGWFTQSWGSARLEWNWASGEPKPGFL